MYGGLQVFSLIPCDSNFDSLLVIVLCLAMISSINGGLLSFAFPIKWIEQKLWAA